MPIWQFFNEYNTRFFFAKRANTSFARKYQYSFYNYFLGLPLEVILGTVIAVTLLLAVAGAALWLRLRSMTRGQCYKAADWAGASKHSSGGAGHHHSRKDDNFATEISCPHLIRESSTKSVNEIQSTSSHQSKKITSVQGSRAGHAHQSGSAIHDDGYGTESGSNNKVSTSFRVQYLMIL